MGLGEAAAVGDLDPDDLIDELVTPLLELLEGPLVLRIDDPDEDEAVLLELGDGEVRDGVVGELAVSEGHASGRVRGGELPGRVHHDDVEIGVLVELAPVVGDDVGVDRDALGRNHPLGLGDVVHVALDEPVILPVLALTLHLALLLHLPVHDGRGLAVGRPVRLDLHLDLLLVLEVRGLDVLEILLARDHGLPVLGHLLVQAGILKLGPSSDAFILGFHQERSLGLLGRHAGLCGARARHLDCVRKLKREGKRFAADAALGMSLHVGCTDRHRADTRLHFLREERDLLV